jgi:prepilin-type N-terminal cleavage/methylation domain-containing protein
MTKGETPMKFGRSLTLSRTNAFTLSELLVVVGIIAILAAIAIPNLLEAQVRSKVSRTKADLRSVSVGMETYAVDYNAYPNALGAISTPVAYLSAALVPDVFANPHGLPTIGYVQAKQASTESFLESFNVTGTTADERAGLLPHGFFIFSNGPDRIDQALEDSKGAFYDVIRSPGAKLGYYYDPTNGTLSRGDITRSAKLTS